MRPETSSSAFPTPIVNRATTTIAVVGCTPMRTIGRPQRQSARANGRARRRLPVSTTAPKPPTMPPTPIIAASHPTPLLPRPRRSNDTETSRTMRSPRTKSWTMQQPTSTANVGVLPQLGEPAEQGVDRTVRGAPQRLRGINTHMDPRDGDDAQRRDDRGRGHHEPRLGSEEEHRGEGRAGKRGQAFECPTCDVHCHELDRRPRDKRDHCEMCGSVRGRGDAAYRDQEVHRERGAWAASAIAIVACVTQIATNTAVTTRRRREAIGSPRAEGQRDRTGKQSGQSEDADRASPSTVEGPHRQRHHRHGVDKEERSPSELQAAEVALAHHVRDRVEATTSRPHPPRHPPSSRMGVASTQPHLGGGGRESNPPDGDRPSQPL